MLQRLIFTLLGLLVVSCSSEQTFETPPVTRTSAPDKVAENLTTPWNYSFPEQNVLSADCPEIVTNCGKFWNTLADRTLTVKSRAELLMKFLATQASVGKFQLPELVKDRELLMLDFVSFIDLKRLIKRVGDERWNFQVIALDEFKILEPRLQQAWIKELGFPDLTKHLLADAKIIMLIEKQPYTENILLLIIKQKIINADSTLDNAGEFLAGYEILNISALLYNR